MATVIIPTRTDGTQRYSVRTALGSGTYRIEFFWNTRDSSWSFVLSDSSGNQLFARKITLGAPIFSRFQDARLPYGEMTAVDTSGQNAEPGLTDLGTRVLLLFTDGADIASIK